MPSIFQIGTTSTLSDLETVLSAITPLEPDWSYRAFSTGARLGNGLVQGNGFPIIKWRFNHLTQSQRETLRETYCPVPKISNPDIWINTPITETASGELVWKTFKTVMNWPEEEEDFQADQSLGVIIIFTHCEVQP